MKLLKTKIKIYFCLILFFFNCQCSIDLPSRHSIVPESLLLLLTERESDTWPPNTPALLLNDVNSTLTRPIRRNQLFGAKKYLLKPFAKCAFVGSSSTVSNSSCGSLIDQSDAIIRFNFAPIHGFENDVGNFIDNNKTTFVFLVKNSLILL